MRKLSPELLSPELPCPRNSPCFIPKGVWSGLENVNLFALKVGYGIS